LAAVAEPETNLPAGQALLLAETPGGCQQKELGIRFDEKYGCLAVELEFSEGDEIIEDVPELVLQLGKARAIFQDIINDFWCFKGSWGCGNEDMSYCLLSIRLK